MSHRIPVEDKGLRLDAIYEAPQAVPPSSTQWAADTSHGHAPDDPLHVLSLEGDALRCALELTDFTTAMNALHPRLIPGSLYNYVLGKTLAR